MKTAAEIAREIPESRVCGDSGVLIGGVSHDSRSVAPMDLFAVLSGSRTDGRLFVDEAIEKGASALLVDEPLAIPITQIVVDDVRARLGEVAAAAFDHPMSKLSTVAVTGTNGKTTAVYLVESVLSAVGCRPGVIGTVEYRFEDKKWKAVHTTPEATVIQSVAREMASAGASHLVMEASSHGLFLNRLKGCAFDVAAFTNLTQDHLDFHETMEAYAAAKLLLFTQYMKLSPGARIVVNLDDPFARTIVEHAGPPVVTVSLDTEDVADVHPASPPGFSIKGIEATIRTPEGDCRLSSPLIGRHNLSNLLVALGICSGLGIPYEKACQALVSPGAPGRLERVSNSDLAVLVDYAHTPDALTRVLEALRPLTHGRLICVFGCGGERDTTKRPLMGRAVRDLADVAVVTSDNPRTEDPDSIIDMILPGIEGGGMERFALEDLASITRGYAVQPDRRGAILAAVRGASAGDTVLIAGKGHEDYQILGTERIHFDDREEARAALAQLGDTRND